jgi:prophage maintenance system killer protein
VVRNEKYFSMVKSDNIFFAKRKLVDNLYKSANLEGIKITEVDVVYFLNNVNNGIISVDDMLKLKGLKDAWKFVLNSVDEELTVDYIKKIHYQICKGQSIEPLGDFRDCGVGITGTSWRPKLSSECDYKKELDNIKKIENPLEMCITLFCWIQRSQMFKDGNKRVANLVTNKEMIRLGQGILSVPVEKIGEYFSVLIKFYETNDYTEIKKWIYDNCIDGV